MRDSNVENESIFDSLKHSITSGEFLKSKTFWIGAGTALSAVMIYGLYSKLTKKELTQAEKTKLFIKKELKRLKNPDLTEDGYLEKQDFFDIIMLIQLKSKMKLQRDVLRNQRERVKMLQISMEEDNFQYYFDKTLEIMQKEFEHYEVQFQKILDQIGITNDTWDMSKDLYIQAEGYTMDNTDESQTIQDIEKKVYQFLPVPTIPRNLTKQETKNIMITVNQRAQSLYRNKMQNMNDHVEYEPLLIETLAFDLAFTEYGIQENVFRYATHKYELQKDQEIRDYLDDYIQ